MQRQKRPSDARLFAAADALLEALASPAGHYTLIDMTLAPEDDDDNATRPSGPFTQEEILFAMDFLVRAGFLPES